MSVLDFITVTVISLLCSGGAGFLLKEILSSKIKSHYDSKFSKEIESYKGEIFRLNEVNSDKWKLKYNACMQALSLTDAILSNFNGHPLTQRKDYDVNDVRDCINKLSCCCDGPDVYRVFKKIASVNDYSLDIIVDLRNAVRHELGFSNYIIDDDRVNSFIIAMRTPNIP